MKNKELESSIINGVGFTGLGMLLGGPVGAVATGLLVASNCVMKAKDGAEQKAKEEEWIRNSPLSPQVAQERFKNTLQERFDASSRIMDILKDRSPRPTYKYQCATSGILGMDYKEYVRNYGNIGIHTKERKIILGFSNDPTIYADCTKAELVYQGYLCKSEIFEKMLMDEINNPNLITYSFFGVSSRGRAFNCGFAFTVNEKEYIVQWI